MKKGRKSAVTPTTPKTTLRQRPALAFPEKTVEAVGEVRTLPTAKVRKTRQSLRVDQTDLELQSQKLRRALAELDNPSACFFDFYDLSPVGYCTISHKDVILQANLTSAALLGLPRSELLQQPFVRFILKEDQHRYNQLRRRLESCEPTDDGHTASPQTCELRMMHGDGTIFWAHLIVGAAQDSDGNPVLRVVLNDVSAETRAKAELQQSEARFRNILRDVSSVAVQGYTMDGITTYWNQASEQLYGYTAQEAVGRNLLDLIIPPEMRDGVREAVRQMAETGQAIPAAELSLMRKDGSRVPVFSSHAIVHIPGRATELFCLDVDLTARKRAEAALQASEARHRNTVEFAVDGILHGDRTGKIIGANSQMQQLAGRTLDQLLGLAFHDLFSAEELKERPARFDLLNQGGIVVSERNLLRPDGTTVPVEMHSKMMPDGTYQSIYRNITKRKQAEAALVESEERYQRITQAVTDYIYTVRVANGHAVETTHGPGCLSVTGYRADEFFNDSFLWHRMVVEADRPMVEEQARRILIGEDPPPIEHRIRHKSGAVRWVRNTFVPHRNELGVLSAYDGLIQDVTARKEAEDNLRRVQSNLSALFESTSDMIWSADPMYRIVTFNSALQEHCRRSYGTEIKLGSTPADFLPPERAARWGALYDRALRDGPYRMEYSLTDGREVELSFHPIVNGSEKIGISVFGKDITARKQAELALRENETSLRESQMIAGLGSYVLDIPSGQWQSSEVMDLVFGIPKAPVRTVAEWESMVHPDDRAMMGEYFKNHVLGERQSFNKEYRIVRQDTREARWVHGIGQLETDSDGRLLKMRGTIQDITHRKHAEEAIAALALRNQTLLQTASDGIHVIDEKGNVVEANTAFCRMLGYTREEMLQLNVADWDTQWSREELLVMVGQMISRPAVFETRHRRKDGTIREVEINSAGVALDGRKYLYASARDITERKQAIADKERLTAQNQQLQKTESLSRMAGAIAHHFNNQLQSVMMRLEMALNDLPRNIEPVESLNEAMVSARKAAEVSTQMLTYLGQSFDRKETLDLAEACTQYLPLIRAVMPLGIKLETNLPSPGPSIEASASQIHQVLTNLLTNAWEACVDSRGSIRLTVSKVAGVAIPSINRFPVDWEPRGTDFACLEVADSGCGIAAVDIEKLFDPFFSSKFTGRGLGLSVVLGIARTHHGACTVESEPGKGSIFRIFLPVTTTGIIQ